MRRARALLIVVTLLAPSHASGAELGPVLARLKAVGKEGAGNREASKAWQELVRNGAEALPVILTALDDADIRASNWLRAAVDAIAEKAVAAKQPLPVEQLEAFVLQTKHAPAARRLAYEWLARVDASASDRLVPRMLDDPSVELRRDAVAEAIKTAQAYLDRQDKSAATAAFQKALVAARDRDQVDLVAKRLKSLGAEVDLAAHFGFIRQWQLIAPFDNTGGAGFSKVYPPEKAIELTATYAGKNEDKARWIAYTTNDPYGLVDLNKAIGKHMGVAGYGFAAVQSPTEHPAQIRVSSNNAVKIFFNGKEVFFKEEYHHGMRMDQYVVSGTLKAGRNEILIKVCQNEQKEDWAQKWSFQLRVCDAVGTALPVTVLSEK